MNHLMISFLVAITVLFHIVVCTPVKEGRVRESFCAGWCVDAVFAVCGTIISFAVNHYDPTPFLTLRTLLWGLLFTAAAFLFVLLAPSGLSLFARRKRVGKSSAYRAATDEESDDITEKTSDGNAAAHEKRSAAASSAFGSEKMFHAEYRFNDTLCMVRNFFFALLFALPVLLNLPIQNRLYRSLFTVWNSADICGAFCFTAFLILLPISLRQAFFWLKNLSGEPTETEQQLLLQYRYRLHYRHRNRRL